MGNLTNLDGIRAIAVLLVVVSHLLLQLTEGIEPAVYSLKAMGRMGVAIFFVHTTLVLMASLERHGSAAVPFYIRRAFRIYPLSVAIVLFFALLQVLTHSPMDTEKLLSNLFLVQNITDRASLPMPLWSLPYENQMYLVLPALYAVTRSRRALSWIGAILAISVFVISLAPSDSMLWKLGRFVPCFLPGVLAFVLLKRRHARAHSAVLFGLIFVAGVFGVPALVAAGLPELPLMWALCLAIGLAIPMCRQLEDGWLARASQLIAKYSYGIYLTHVIALGAIDGLMPGPAMVQWAAMLVLLPGLAYICYHGIEKRGIAIGSSLADRLTANARRKASATSLPSSGSGPG